MFVDRSSLALFSVLSTLCPRIGQGHAEGADIAIADLGRFQEERALAGGEIFAGAIDGVELHAARRPGAGALLPRNGLPRGNAWSRTRGSSARAG
jgi:hypothetical protein